MASFNKMRVKKLYLPDGSKKAPLGKSTLVTATASELNIMDGVTATAAELNIMDGVTADKDELNLMDGCTSTTAELNILDGATVVYQELNLLDNVWASVATTWTDGTDGTGEVQFVFADAAGTTMATPVAGTFYISEVATGLTVDALDTGLAVATNGVVNIMDTGSAKYYKFVSSAAGLLGLTLTSNADSYWVVFEHLGGLVISDELAITGP